MSNTETGSDPVDTGTDIDTDYIRDSDPTIEDRGPRDAPWIDRSHGSGATDWGQDNADATSRRPANDGRSRTRTTFYADDGGADHIDWDQLAKLQDGVGSPDRSSQNHQADRRRIVESIGSTLDVTDYQQERAQAMLSGVNVQETYPTRPVEHVALAALTLAIDADVRDVDRRSTARDEVQSMMSTVGVDGPTELHQIRRKLREL